jgi:multicomponent Na+:H+ antiporter subunit D
MIVLWPLFISFFFGSTLIFLKGSSRKTQNQISLVGAGFYLVSSVFLLQTVLEKGIQATQIGNWQAPFGITFISDVFSALMILVTGVIYFVGLLYARSEISEEFNQKGFYSLLHFLILGVSGAFLTGDYFNMYVWYEVMILSSFGLMALSSHKKSKEGLLKYAVLNFLASSFFLMGLGLLYGVVGSLNIADVTQKLASFENSRQALGAAFFMAFGFAMKAGLFPLYSWLPTSYHLSTFTVSGIFAGLLTKVGLYSLIRLLGMSFSYQKDVIMPFFIVGSILTMLMGVFGAATQFSTRRILSFHIVSQIGYMTLSLGFFTEKAFAATLFYLIHHILVKSNLFFIAGLIYKTQGVENLKLAGSGLKKTPWLALVFLISGFSLGGIPPLSGFFAKLALLKEGLLLQEYLAVGVGFFVGLLTLYSMTKIWAEAFWKEAQPQELRSSGSLEKSWSCYGAVFILALLTLWISFNPDSLMEWASLGAETLINPESYIKAVFR